MTSPREADRFGTADAAWWRQAVVYEIYPRSFADSDGDGIGDLAGITSRVPHLVALGVDAVWLTPFYPSALIDGGYDIDDHRGVDPRLGTLADFDRMVAALHAAGIRVVVDIVPKHTSDRHPWFREALAAGRGSPARDRYVFRDGAGPAGDAAPSDWVSMFGGPAWTRVADGQFYLHLYATEQPDLNWDNADVRADFVQTLRFWADRGVDGFRVDVANAPAKNLTAPLPTQADLDAVPADHPHPVWDQNAVHEIYAEWRRVLDDYDPPRSAVAEAWVPAHRRVAYAAPTGLGQAFDFDLLEADFDAAAFRAVITRSLTLAAESGSSSTWVLSSHDSVRHATRYALPPRAGAPVRPGTAWLLTGGTTPEADVAAGLSRARAATLLMLALPGSAYLFQGEELGLPEVADIPDSARQDPTFARSPGRDVGRDGCRVPLPWTSHGPSFGFGPAGTHLPQPRWFSRFAADRQAGDPASTLAMYRAAIALRRRLQGAETPALDR